MKIEAMLRPQLKKPVKINTDRNTLQMRILTGVLAAGIVFGILIYLMHRTMMVDQLSENMTSVMQRAGEQTFPKRFLGYIAADCLTMLVLFLLGSSTYGGPIVYVLLFLKAAGLGAQACLFVQNDLSQSIGLYYLKLFPQNCLLLFAWLMMGQNSVYTSGEIRKIVQEQGRENKRILPLFTVRSFVAWGIVLAADLFKAALPMLFHLSSDRSP